MRTSIMVLGAAAFVGLGSAASAQTAAPFLETPCGVSRPAPSCAFSAGGGAAGGAGSTGYQMSGGIGGGAMYNGGGGGVSGGGASGGGVPGMGVGLTRDEAVEGDEDTYFDCNNTCDVAEEAPAGETPMPSPVPVPAGLPLLLGGLAVIAGLRRRR